MCGWRWRDGWLMAAAVVAAGAACEPSRAETTESWIPRRVLDPLDQCPTWTGRTDALLLWRDAPQGVGLFDSVGPGAGLNAADLASGMAAGPRFSLFRHTGDLGALEFTFFRVQDFTASRTLPATDGDYLFAPGVLCCNLKTPLNDAGAALASEFQSFELNRRFPTDGRVQWLAGFRWVQWNESLGLGAVTDVPGQTVDIDTATNNDLYGMQVGLDSILWRNGSRFWIEGLGKAGLFYNRSGQFTSFEQSLPPPFPDERVAGGTSTSRAAFVGELGVTGVWQVTDWLAIRTGWVAFWLSGIAQSPNQLAEQCLICEDRPIRQATDTGGSVFVNGLTLGLEARW
jgi:hypothetical protein